MRNQQVIKGKVVHGHGVGKDIGFPTANLEVDELPDIEPGVYLASTSIEDEDYFGMMYFGPRTVHNEKIYLVEINIFDFVGDLYDEELTLEIHEFIREPIDMRTLEEVKQQLKQDKDDCLEIIDSLAYKI